LSCYQRHRETFIGNVNNIVVVCRRTGSVVRAGIIVVTFVNIECGYHDALNERWNIEHIKIFPNRERLVELVHNTLPDPAKLAWKAKESEVAGKDSEHAIQKVQVGHIVYAAKLGFPQFFDEIEEDIRKGWVEEKAVKSLSRCTASTEIQTGWVCIVVKIPVGVGIIDLEGGVLAELCAVNKGVPLVGCGPPLLPQYGSILAAVHDNCWRGVGVRKELPNTL
jgi:hypothetical protein